MSFLSRLGKFVGRTVAGVASGQNPISAAIGAAHPSQFKTVGGTAAGPIQNAMIYQSGSVPSLPRGPVLPGAGVMGGSVANFGMIPSAGTVVKAGKALVKVGLPFISKYAAEIGGLIAIGQLWYDAAGNAVGRRKSRRINPMNVSALRRAARRIKSAKKIVKLIEKVSPSHHRRAAPAPFRRKR